MLGDNWGNALLQGQQFGQNDIDQNYLNAAHAANVAKYGPQAGDPAAMASLQATNFLAQDQPSTLRTLQGNANVANAQGQIAQGTIGSTIAANNVNNSTTIQSGPSIVQNNKAAAATNTAAATSATIGADAALAAQHANAAAAAASAAQTHLNANPGDTEGAYQAGVAAAASIAPDEAKQYAPGTPQGDAFHKQFSTDPAGTINGINAQVRARTEAALATMSPQQRIEFMQKNADMQKVGGDILDQKQKAFQAASENEKTILAGAGPTGVVMTQAESALKNIEQMRALLGKVSGSTTWNAAVQAHVPGSNMQQLEALAEATGSALSVDMLQGAKAAGGSLGVRASNTEFKGIGESLMKIDPSMTVDQMKAQLDNAEKAVNVYRQTAQNMLDGPNGPAEYKNAVARRQQTELDYNSALGVYAPQGAASPAAPAQPAAPASPSGAAAQPLSAPMPRLGADAAPAPQANPIGTFNAALQHTFGAEGGYNAKDANGAPVNMGINQAAHPGVDVANLTHDKASQIYKSEYWDAIGGDQLAKTSPGLAHAGFDIAVVDGAPKAKELIAKAGGDPNKLVDLQQQFQNNLIARDPSKYGKYADTWAKRNAALKADIASGTVGNSYVTPGAPDTHTLANGGATGSWAPITQTPNAPITPVPVPQQAQQPASEPRQQASAQSPAARAAPAQAQALASATYDPLTGASARAFQGQRSAVMDGRALLAKYLRDVA